MCSLLESYYPRMVAYARHFTQDESAAEDVVQDALFNFFRKYTSVSSEDFPRIIFKIVRNCCLNWIKHNKVVEKVIVAEPPKGEMLYNYDFLAQDADGDYLYLELLKQVETIMEKLPPRCRQVFEMSRFKQMRNEEIAQAMGISIKTVKNQMTHALSVFRKSMDRKEFLLFLLFFINFQ